MADRLNQNEDLVQIGSLTSPNAEFTLVMQGDGNLVLYRLGGKYRWDTKTDGQQVSQAVMQADGNFVMYGPGGAYIWDSGTDGHPGATLVVQDDGNVVIYASDGKPLWATDTNIIRGSINGFLPSTSGFKFSNNDFASVPLITIDALLTKIPVGDASKGLCGGMVYAARDFFEAGIAIPSETNNPASGPLFDYLVRRLIDSFNLPLGPARYTGLMNPVLPDHETDMSKLGVTSRGRAWIMIKEEWPKIKKDIDNGRLSTIGLIHVKSLDPTQLGENHQALVYGYELDGNDLAMHVYDPNHPKDNNIRLSLNIGDPEHTTEVSYPGSKKVWCFFRTNYGFASPLNAVYAYDVSAFALGRNKDGRLEVFHSGNNSRLYHTWQTAPNGGWVGNVLLQTDETRALRLAVDQNQDGRLEVFYIGTDNRLYHNWQLASGAWHGQNLLVSDTAHAKNLAVARNSDGRLEVFYIGTDNRVYHTWQLTPNGGWSGQVYLNDSNNKAKALTVAANQDGRLEVYYIGSNNRLYHTWQQTHGGWSGEHELGGVKAKALAAGRNADGRLEVFFAGMDNRICHLWQLQPNGGWSNAVPFGNSPYRAKALTIGLNTNGSLEVFYIGTDNRLYHRWQSGAGTWSEEHFLGSDSNMGKALEVGQNADGRLEVFYIGTDNRLYHNWQVRGGGWSGENRL